MSRWERFLRWLGVLPCERFLFDAYSASCWAVGETVKSSDGRAWRITSLRRIKQVSFYEPEWEVWGVPA